MAQGLQLPASIITTAVNFCIALFIAGKTAPSQTGYAGGSVCCAATSGIKRCAMQDLSSQLILIALVAPQCGSAGYLIAWQCGMQGDWSCSEGGVG